MTSEDYMCLALQLAAKGRFAVHPNPMVGAVIVRGGKIISKGYHSHFGGPHAEIAALKKLGNKARGATLYVTLEPCSTYGKTPPCVAAILQSGIRKVVVGSKDPNPKHNGKGIRLLKKNRIEVEVGILSEKVARQNEAFFFAMKNRRPFVTLKLAMSLDGKIAAASGDSRWISSEPSRKLVHELRASSDAVLVGTQTLLRDNPRLNVRGVRSSFKEPYKVVLDSQLQIAPRSALFQHNQAKNILIFTSHAKKNAVKKKYLVSRGVKIVAVAEKQGRLWLPEILEKLFAFEIYHLLVEGGSEMAGSFFDRQFVNKIYFFLVPILLGGSKTASAIGGKGVTFVKNAVKMKSVVVKKSGSDYLFSGYPDYSSVLLDRSKNPSR